MSTFISEDGTPKATDAPAPTTPETPTEGGGETPEEKEELPEEKEEGTETPSE